MSKPFLTPEENLSASYAVLVLGVHQAVVAATLGVSNQGRVNEAVQAMRYAMADPKGVRRLVEQEKQRLAKAGKRPHHESVGGERPEPADHRVAHNVVGIGGRVGRKVRRPGE